MESGQLMTDILVNVSCKFEMYIFKIAQVINENIHIAFLYVLSIYIYTATPPRKHFVQGCPHAEQISERFKE